jgi:hypothetical protein
MSDFQGFRRPTQNWYALPNEWTDITAKINSLAELKVIEYVLRHTWGFNRGWGKFQRISTEEFSNGRKRKKGGRIDQGTGLSQSSVYEGLKKAVRDGYLVEQIDKRDLGRITKSYKVRMTEEDPSPNTGDHLPEIGEDIPKIGDRSSKDTSSKDTSSKCMSGPSPDGANGSSKPSRKKPTLRDQMTCRELKRIVSKHIKVNGKANLREWANQFRLMRERDGVSQDDINEALEWYDDHIGEEYIPEAFSAKSFREKYSSGKIPAAMKRTKTQPVKTDSQGRTPDELERDHVWATLMNRQEGRMRKPSREELDEVLDELGIARDKYETYQM